MFQWFAQLLAALLALVGVIYTLLAARAAARLAATPPARAPALAACILKPLHGAPPGLAENLTATLAQRHAAPFSIRCGLAEAADPAAAVVGAVLAAQPGAAITLRVDPTQHGPNRKVSQLVNLSTGVAEPVLVVADADMLVPPDWLTAVTAPLADPTIGLVTCLYHGQPANPGLWSRLAALGIDWQFLPNAALGEALGMAEGCYGATMALRTETLEKIGGFLPLAGLLADDHALGVAVRRLGLRVVMSPVLPGHVMAEGSLTSLLGHELRWAATLRLLNPGGYAGMAITHPLAWGLLAALLGGGGGLGLAALTLALAGRLAAAAWLDRALGKTDYRRLMLLPLRDLISFAIWAAGLARRGVVWQGRRYRLRRDGSMVEMM